MTFTETESLLPHVAISCAPFQPVIKWLEFLGKCQLREIPHPFSIKDSRCSQFLCKAFVCVCPVWLVKRQLHFWEKKAHGSACKKAIPGRYEKPRCSLEDRKSRQSLISKENCFSNSRFLCTFRWSFSSTSTVVFWCESSWGIFPPSRIDSLVDY